MIDPGPEIMLAAQAVNLPCWRGAWQANEEGGVPPPVYAVFNAQVAQGYSADDLTQAQRQWIYLNIYGDGDVWAAADALEGELLQRGWRLISRQDVYDSEAAKNMQALSLHREVMTPWAVGS